MVSRRMGGFTYLGVWGLWRMRGEELVLSGQGVDGEKCKT